MSISDPGTYLATITTQLTTMIAQLATLSSSAVDGTPDTDHTAMGPQTDTFAAGAAITVMDLVYMGNVSKWLASDANAASTSTGLLGISLATKVDTQLMNTALPGTFVRDDTWNWTPGAILYVSETASAITATEPPTVGAISRIIGYAVTADVIWFDPDTTWLIVA